MDGTRVDALGPAVGVAVQRQAPGVLLAVGVVAHHVQRIADVGVLDRDTARGLEELGVQQHRPAAVAVVRDAGRREAVAGDLHQGAGALDQLGLAGLDAHVLDELLAAGRGQEVLHRKDLLAVVLAPVVHPAVHLLPHVEGEGVDVRGWYLGVPAQADRGAVGEVGRDVGGHVALGARPAQTDDDVGSEQREDDPALDAGGVLCVGEGVGEARHGDLLALRRGASHAARGGAGCGPDPSGRHG